MRRRLPSKLTPGSIVNYLGNRYSRISFKAATQANPADRLILSSLGAHENIKVIENPRDVIAKYKKSFMLARDAGFDGVELLAQG